VLTLDAAGVVVEFNPEAARLFDRRREDVVDRGPWSTILSERTRQQILAGFAHYRTSGENGLIGRRFGTTASRPDGSEFPVEVALSMVGAGGAAQLTIFVCDATESVRAHREVAAYQKRLRALMADLLLAEERERRKLSMDLHDGLSQTIALIRFRLGGLRRGLNTEQSLEMDQLEALVDQANRDARSIGFELSPPVLHDLGFQAAIQWLVENIQTRYGLQITLDDDGVPKPADEGTRVILFRSIRELLINAAKHSAGQRAWVRLRRDRELVEVLVEDDGVGMSPEPGASSGCGLISIRERLRHVGGSMHIESTPGAGTKVRLLAPLNSKVPARSPAKERAPA